MPRKIRPEISKKNRYYIPKERHLELVHFCLQYPDWKQELKYLDGYSCKSGSVIEGSRTGEPNDPTFRMVERREYFTRKVEMVNSCALTAADNDPDLAAAIIMAVTEGIGWEKILALGKYNCPKDAWYEVYRKFFWLLSFARG